MHVVRGDGAGTVERVPLVDVTFDPSVGASTLEWLASALLDAVAEGVACEEEPWAGPPGPGDVEWMACPEPHLDVGELAIVIEVHTKHLASRAVDPQARADLIADRLRPVLDPLAFGVWLILLEGAWAQRP
jgi:hypothetical protein